MKQTDWILNEILRVVPQEIIHTWQKNNLKEGESIKALSVQLDRINVKISRPRFLVEWGNRLLVIVFISIVLTAVVLKVTDKDYGFSQWTPLLVLFGAASFSVVGIAWTVCQHRIMLQAESLRTILNSFEKEMEFLVVKDEGIPFFSPFLVESTGIQIATYIQDNESGLLEAAEKRDFEKAYNIALSGKQAQRKLTVLLEILGRYKDYEPFKRITRQALFDKAKKSV